jgi:hypothetical protein
LNLNTLTKIYLKRLAAMTVKKRFAQDGSDLDGRMDQLVEVLAQLLDEPSHPGEASAPDDLHLGGRESHACQ